MMYQGLREDGTWEDFEWDLSSDPTAEDTGYEEIRPVDISDN